MTSPPQNESINVFYLIPKWTEIHLTSQNYWNESFFLYKYKKTLISLENIFYVYHVQTIG